MNELFNVGARRDRARYVHVLDADDERAVEVISDAIGPAFRKKSNETS